MFPCCQVDIMSQTFGEIPRMQEAPHLSRSRPYRGNLWCDRAVRFLIGGLLLTAAALKGEGLTLGALAQDSFLSTPRLQIATIQVEILLGLWLLSGQAMRMARVAAIGKTASRFSKRSPRRVVDRAEEPPIR
jgi:hypothetical protein